MYLLVYAYIINCIQFLYVYVNFTQACITKLYFDSLDTGRSTTRLMNLTEDISGIGCRGKRTGRCFLDVEKAFRSILHDIDELLCILQEV